MTDGYNGWKNKETWLVNLWLGGYFEAMEEEGVEVTADRIKEWVEEWIPESSNGFMTDLLNCALGEIDYDELADHYKEDAE